MSDIYENKEIKINSLFSEFKKEGYTSRDIINKDFLINYLNNHSSTGLFDQVILNKLFQVLSLDSSNEINIEDFISGYLQFEEDIKNNIEELNIKLNEKQKIYDELVENYKRYKEEKLNSEGLSEDSKIYGEITEVDIQRKLKGIKEIIIKVIFNDKLEEFHLGLGELNEIENMKFEFKPTSRKDHFEFIMQGLNNQQNVFDIGRKVFSLTDVDTQEEYLAQIIIPEIDNKEKISAYINTKIVIYWNDNKYYEEKIIKAEEKLKKLIISLNKASNYLKKIREIYGNLSKNQEIIIDFNNEKLIEKNVNENKKEEKELEVEFNNEKLVQLETDFNNNKEIKEKNIQKENEIKEVINKEENQKDEIIQTNIEEPKKVETKENEVQVSNEDIQSVIRETAEIKEDEPLNNNDNKEIDNKEIIEKKEIDNKEIDNKEIIEKKEVEKEIEIKNVVNEEKLIRQSIKEILNEPSTLPVIVRQKVNQIIYDKNVTTLPLIYGETKITYLKEGESPGIGLNNINGQNYLQVNEGIEYTQEINQNNFQVNQIQNYNIEPQDIQINEIAQSQNNYLQPEYGQNFISQSYSFEEYKKTNY